MYCASVLEKHIICLLNNNHITKGPFTKDVQPNDGFSDPSPPPGHPQCLAKTHATLYMSRVKNFSYF